MRNSFRAYYKKSPKEIKAIWDQALITFDANVLLNLYRYSPDTKNEILRLMRKLNYKVFLTHQAGLEFHENRLKVINTTSSTYKNFADKLTAIENEIRAKHSHPFLSDKIQRKFGSVLSEVREELLSIMKLYSELLNIDSILDDITDLFNGKIEQAFTEKDMINLLAEGKRRFENKIPPGFEDEKEKGNGRQFGDLILWKQVMQKAKQEKKPIILVTEERKKDWWRITGEIVEQRPELSEELFKEAGVEFMLIRTEKFLELGSMFFLESTNKKVIEEVKEQRKDDQKKSLLIGRFHYLKGRRNELRWMLSRLSDSDTPNGEEIVLTKNYSKLLMEIDLEINGLENILSDLK